MTCRMAAGQQKKQLRSSNIYEQYRGKKKRKVDSSDRFVNFKSHVKLQWDDSQKRVVPKMDQIGISWQDISPFIDSVAQSHSGIADVIAVPCDIFSLEDLTEVLSYKGWVTSLSESEKNILTQFLPSGTDAEQVVCSLLKGDNHHFGNPLWKWSTSLCTGNCHPDVLLRKERKLKMRKNTYYHNLNKYHTGMLELLTKWTQKWLSCKDPEKLQSNEFFKKEAIIAVAGEKAKFSTSTKREMSQKIGSQKYDINKYLSYIKISRSHHEMVKNMKHSGDGIPAKSLAHVIGDIKNFHVHPYKKFEEEENKRLHDHWLQVVKEDIPAAYELASERKLLREQWMKSLEEELVEEQKLTMDVEVERSQNPNSSSQGNSYEGYSGNQHIADVEDEIGADSKISADEDQLENNPPCDTDSELVVSESEMEEPANNNMSHFSHTSVDESQKQNASESEVSASLAKQMWHAGNVQDSYYNTVDSNGYTSAGELSIRQTLICCNHAYDMIDLERDGLLFKAGQPMQSLFEVQDCVPPIFANQERSEVLPSFPKAALLSSYQHEQINSIKQSGLQLLMCNASLPESEFHNQLEEPSQLAQSDARDRGLYMHPIINKNLYAANSYSSQGSFPTIEQQSFAALQPSINGGYNWFPVDNQPYNSWYGIESSSGGTSMANCAGIADGNLCSVFPNNLPTTSTYDAMSSGQYVQGRNLTGGVLPSSQNIYGYAPHQLENPSFHDVTVVPSMGNAPWINISRQNPSLNDSLGRPYIRPWNR